MCNKPVSWVCSVCSTDLQHLVPMHPTWTIGRKTKRGVKVYHPCSANHQRNPFNLPHGICNLHSGKNKRGKMDDAAAEDLGAEEECSECEE